MLSTLWRKTGNFLRHSRFVQIWFIPLWFLLGASKVLIFTVSFHRLAPRLGRASDIAAWVPLLTPKQEALALRIGRAVQLAANYTPWDSNCFPQAMAARLLLGLYDIPYALYFGLMRDPVLAEMKAHAWVVAGRIRVTGGASFGQFAVVGCFISPSLYPPNRA